MTNEAKPLQVGDRIRLLIKDCYGWQPADVATMRKVDADGGWPAEPRGGYFFLRDEGREWERVPAAPEAPAEKPTPRWCTDDGVNWVACGSLGDPGCSHRRSTNRPPAKAQEPRFFVAPWHCASCPAPVPRTAKLCLKCEALLVPHPSNILKPTPPPTPYVPRLTEWDLLPDVSAADTVMGRGR